MTEHDRDVLTGLSALALHERYASGDVRPLEAVDAVLERIHRYAHLNAFFEIHAEEAQAAAHESEERYRTGRACSRLDGVPVSIKDHIAVRGMRTPRGGLHGPGTLEDDDAPVVARLREAGAIIIGKTTMPELSVIPDTSSARFGITRNPLDIERSPGGSSGGAAAAVAAGLGPIAIGSDGGGSIRLPAAFTNLVGLKPTHGLVPYWPTPTDRTVVGPLTRDVADAAATMEIIAQPDGRDWMELPLAAPREFSLESGGLRDLRVALTMTLGSGTVDPAVGDAVRVAVGQLEGIGATVDELEQPFPRCESAYYTIATLRLLGHVPPATASPTVCYVYDHAQRISTADIQRYFAERDELAEAFMRLFASYDIIVSPTSPTIAPRVGEFYPDCDPLGDTGRNQIAFTCPYNLVHLPAITIPCGFAGTLPAGLQIGGRKGADLYLLQIAAALERHMSVLGPKIVDGKVTPKSP